MKIHSSVIAAATLSLATFALAAPPADDQGVKAYLSVAKVGKGAGGTQKLQSAKDAEPGDIVEYRVTYRNTDYARARGVVGTLSIPFHRMKYVPDSATNGILLEASVDGKTFEPVPLKRVTIDDEGHTKMEPVPAEEYRYLRWQLGDLPARGTVTVSARMKIEGTPEVVVRNESPR